MVNPLLHKVEALLGQLPISTALVMPSGEHIGPANARVTLKLKNLHSLAHLSSGQIGLIAGDYVEGDLDIEANMRDLMASAEGLLCATGNNSPIVKPKVQWLSGILQHAKSLQHHTRQMDSQQIEFHYDVSNDFYALWLDPRRVYSCAYFREQDLTLAQAQEAKLDHICRKLRLQPGERFLDIGAGWGALLLWAAENYGVNATGITLSKNQHAYVTRLIEEKGLQNRVRMLLCDYRELKEAPYDKVASVGMFEHVGKAHMLDYFCVLKRLLKPGGLFMNHGITAGGTRNHAVGQGMGDFIGKYIFPGGELVHISAELEAAADAQLEALDVECLRPHYAKTLWAWSDALEAQLDKARALVRDKVLRAYRLYLAGCAMSFERGWVSIYQLLGSSPDLNMLTGEAQTGLRGAQSSYPFNRAYIYTR